MNQKSMLTAQDLAERFGVSIYTIYRLTTKPNGLPGYRVGRCIRFKEDEVERYLAAQAVKPVERAEVQAGYEGGEFIRARNESRHRPNHSG